MTVEVGRGRCRPFGAAKVQQEERSVVELPVSSGIAEYFRVLWAIRVLDLILEGS